MIRINTAGICLILLAALAAIPDCCRSRETQHAEAKSATEKQALPKPDLSVDDARMIVKDIPSVDIRATLGTWKLRKPSWDNCDSGREFSWKSLGPQSFWQNGVI